MAANNTVYENEVIQAKLTELLNTKMNVRSMMKIDSDLAVNAGTKKVINVYTYTGAVEDLDAGDDNSVIGALTFTPATYEAIWTQGQFQYTDEDFAMDPQIVDMGIEGVSKAMINSLNTKFFAELAKASLGVTYANGGTLGYDTIVDAIAEMDTEDESNLFIIIGEDLKAGLRKDDDFKAAQLGSILFNGQIGTVAGLPVIESKLCPAGTAYVVDKNAVTLFVKKDAEVEQFRVAGTRTNGVILRRVALVALTDATRIVEITEAES
jgi:hypothetical protein